MGNSDETAADASLNGLQLFNFTLDQVLKIFSSLHLAEKHFDVPFR